MAIFSSLAEVWRQQEVGDRVLDVVDVVTIAARHLSLDDLRLHEQSVQFLQDGLIIFHDGVQVLWLGGWNQGVSQVLRNLQDSIPVQSIQHVDNKLGVEFLLLLHELAFGKL